MRMMGADAFNPGMVSAAGPRIKPIVNPAQPMSPKAPVMGRPLPRPVLGSFKKGGKVTKTGIYKLHAGEKVMPVSAMLRAK